MNCPKCGYLMSDLDLECPRCVRMATEVPRLSPTANQGNLQSDPMPTCHRSTERKREGLGSRIMAYRGVNGSNRSPLWTVIRVVLACAGALAVGWFIVGGIGGTGSTKAVDIHYHYTIFRQAVNDSGNPVADTTTTLPAGLGGKTYEEAIKKIVERVYVGRTTGHVWVFDDADAEKLQWLPISTDLTQQQQDEYDKHLRAMAAVLEGRIDKIATY
jgi:hypothetical protein